MQPYCRYTGKIRYRSKKAALKSRPYAPGGKVLTAYKCNKCNAWHLGNKPTAEKILAGGSNDKKG